MTPAAHQRQRRMRATSGPIWVEFRSIFGIRSHLAQGEGRDTVNTRTVLSPLPPRPRQRAAMAWNAAAPGPAEDLGRAALPDRTSWPVGDPRRITPGGVAGYLRERARPETMHSGTAGRVRG